MRVHEKFTPEVMLSAPRRSPGVPNHDGTLILYNVSTHKFNEKTVKEVKVMDIKTASSKVLSSDDKVHDALWVPGHSNDVIYLKSGEKGITQVIVANGADPAKDHYVVTEINAPIRSMKLKALDDGAVAFAVVGLVGGDGQLHNDEAVERKSTVRVFDTLQVRSWNTLCKDHRYAIWFSKLTEEDGQWKLAGKLHNAVRDTVLDAPDGTRDVADPLNYYDISSKGIVFAAQDPNNSDPALAGTSQVYYVPLRSFDKPTRYGPGRLAIPGGAVHRGFCSNVRFSPDASMAAFIFCPVENPADRRLFMGHLNSMGVFDAFKMVIGRSLSLPPSSFEFSDTAESIFLTTEDCGRQTLSLLRLQHHAQPIVLVDSGVVAGFYPLGDGNHDRLLVSSNSVVESSLWQIVDATGHSTTTVEVSSLTKNGALYGLSPRMVSEFWFEGADESCVHSFMFKPSNFDENKKYPWVLAPHGGPESAWTDGWNTRWNMALWAEQGYVIVCPNIAGSTGYGLDFTARIYRSWGGAPYQDLVNLMEYLKDVPYLDMDRATVAGASYGGYMVSWMLGHDLIRKFRCAIWHDGIYNLPAFMLMTDSTSAAPDFNGLPYSWVNGELMEKWNPARPDLLENWKHAPPTLVIHSEKDYRCPITEGLATYNTLKAQGVHAKFMTFSDECHWVLNPENSIEWHREVFDFMKTHSGGPGPVDY